MCEHQTWEPTTHNVEIRTLLHGKELMDADGQMSKQEADGRDAANEGVVCEHHTTWGPMTHNVER